MLHRSLVAAAAAAAAVPLLPSALAQNPPVFKPLPPTPFPLTAAEAVCALETCFLMGGFFDDFTPNANISSLNVSTPAFPANTWDTDFPDCYPVPECGGVAPFAAAAVVWDPSHAGHYTVWSAGGEQTSGQNGLELFALTSYYDPWLGAWQVAANGNIPLGNQLDMPGVSKHALLALNSTLYLVGGAIWLTNEDFEVSNATLTFDTNFPQASAWVNLPLLALPQPTAMHGAVAVGTRIFVAGGSPNWEDPRIGGFCTDPVSPPNGPYGNAWMLDVSAGPEAGVWTALNPLNYPRCGLSLVADAENSVVYAMGGWIPPSGGVGSMENTGIIEVLDISGDVANAVWQVVHPPLPTSKAFMAAAQVSAPPGQALPPGLPFAFLAGGWDGTNSLTNETWGLFPAAR
jgi:hypothetical protein